MSLTLENQTVNTAFFQPLTGLADASPHARACPEFPDADYLESGVLRVLETSGSGRAFLQEHGPRLPHLPTPANYFVTLQSRRRQALLTGANLALLAAANRTLPDRLAAIPELARYECFAADGHWHQAGTHDPRHQGARLGCGSFLQPQLAHANPPASGGRSRTA